MVTLSQHFLQILTALFFLSKVAGLPKKSLMAQQNSASSKVTGKRIVATKMAFVTMPNFKNIRNSPTIQTTTAKSLSSKTTEEKSALLNNTQVLNGPFHMDKFAKTNCWGRRPLLIRSAFDVDATSDYNEENNVDKEKDSFSWPTWDDVVELAQDEDAESRLITHYPGYDSSYRLELGPFDLSTLDFLMEKDFNSSIYDFNEDDYNDYTYSEYGSLMEPKPSPSNLNDEYNSDYEIPPDYTYSEYGTLKDAKILPDYTYSEDGSLMDATTIPPPNSSTEVDFALGESSTIPKPPKSTLVVNDVDRFHPPLASWIHQIFCTPSSSSSTAFLPRWRIDDGQISLAHKGGGIGPHVDDYDVFLIQMSGSRTWEIGKRLISPKEEFENLVEGIDVRILQHWEKERERDNTETLLLKEGDVLYLPPRVPHCGTALTDGCSTLSVGCRAPSTSEMLSRWAEVATRKVSGCIVERYRDDHLLDSDDGEIGKEDTTSSPGIITEDAKIKAKQLILNAVSEFLDGEDESRGLEFDEFFGKLVTEPNRVRMDYPPSLILKPIVDDDVSEEEREAHQEWIQELGVWGNPFEAVKTVLDGKGCLYQAEGVIFAYSHTPLSSIDQEMHRLFVNGDMYEIITDTTTENDGDSLSRHPLCTIADNRRLSRGDFISRSPSLYENKDDEQILSDEMIHLLEELVIKGYLYGSDE